MSTALPDPGPDPALAAEFDPQCAGTIRGRVIWQGEAPVVPPFQVWSNPSFSPSWPPTTALLAFPNPNAPVIHKSGGVAQAVVFLRQVEPKKSRPWDHGAVTVAYQNYRIDVSQGKTSLPTGFVRRGDAVQFVSGEERFHIARARQAAFFSLTLPRPDQPRSRKLTGTGLVELTDAAEYYWLRAYLFVANHPYYTHTDQDGNFTLEQVPAGDYELVAWLPNWNEASHDRSPEGMFYSRLFFYPPVKQTRKVHIGSGQSAEIQFDFRTEMFTK